MIGERMRLEVGPVAHGGHCVARHDGQVVFVRHTLPGEVVDAVVTKGKTGDRFVFADAVEVIEPSPDRVAPRCGVSGPGGCGGCDFQHVALSRQRDLKADVVKEQLARLAGIEREVNVESVPGDADGLRWRTRMQFSVDREGQAGLKRYHSRDVIPLRDCPIAVEEVTATGALERRRPAAKGVDVVVPNVGRPRVVSVPGEVKDSGHVTERVDVPAGEGHRGFSGEFQVPTRGFWQVHPGAAPTLVEAVLAGVRAQPGERCWDLYSGVGLFAAALAEHVGEKGRVVAVESEPRSVAAARRGFERREEVDVVQARTEDALAVDLADEPVDIVVLDPPRTGAGAEVVAAITRARPRVIAYVACDPAALARDLATATQHGYRLDNLRAFDLFPMTHHVECVAILSRAN